MAYEQKGHPYPVTSCGRRRSFMQSRKEDMPDDRTEESPFNKRKKGRKLRKTTKGKGRNFRTTKEGAGEKHRFSEETNPHTSMILLHKWVPEQKHK